MFKLDSCNTDLNFLLYYSMDLSKYKTQDVHISNIKSGDTILHIDGHIRTVCNNNIKRGFTGITLFGDPYKLGTQLGTKSLI